MDAWLARGRYRRARRQQRWQAGSVGPRRGLGGGARVKVGRGAVVVVELDPTVGREQHGVRPCVVVSDPDVIGDQRFPLVGVVPVTGTPGEGLLYPPLAPGQSGLAKKSFALIDHPILTPPASSSLFFKRSCPLRAIEIPMGNCFLSLPPPPPAPIAPTAPSLALVSTVISGAAWYAFRFSFRFADSGNAGTPRRRTWLGVPGRSGRASCRFPPGRRATTPDLHRQRLGGPR